MRRGRYYALVILALIAVLNTADQAVLLVNLAAIQLDLRLTDTQVGLLSSAFVAVYALAVLPAGYLGDRTSRRMVRLLNSISRSGTHVRSGVADGV